MTQDADRTRNDLPAAPSPQVDETTGAVQGVVTDDSLSPIAGAQALLKEPGLGAVTDASGTFVFSRVAPGSYNLFVAALGFEAIARRVTVEAGEIAQVSLSLVALPVVEPYSELLVFRGFFGCSWTAVLVTGPCFFPGPDINPYLFPDQNRAFYYNVWPHWRTLFAEIAWQQNSLATGSTLSATLSYANRTTSHWWSSVQGTSPLLQRCDRTADEWMGCDGDSQLPEDEPKEIDENGTYTRHFINTGTAEVAGQDLLVFGMAFEQRFELFATVFYWEAMPEGYSARQDT